MKHAAYLSRLPRLRRVSSRFVMAPGNTYQPQSGADMASNALFKCKLLILKSKAIPADRCGPDPPAARPQDVSRRNRSPAATAINPLCLDNRGVIRLRCLPLLPKKSGDTA